MLASNTLGAGGLLLAQIAVAAVSGLYTSAWGAYKDWPHEGFRAPRFLRSAYFSVALLLLMLSAPWLGGIVARMPLAHLFLLVMGVERAWGEFYKLCFRVPREEEIFSISQTMTLFGREIGQTSKAAIGAGLTLFVASLLHISYVYKSPLEFGLVALAAGVGVACAGAYKDAPFEGFDPIRFWRSPAIAMALAPLIYQFPPVPIGILAISFVGAERLCSEYHKSFVLRSIPGKFRSETPVHPDPYKRRRYLHWMAAASLLVFVALYAAYLAYHVLAAL